MPAKFLLEHGHRPCSSQCGWEKKNKNKTKKRQEACCLAKCQLRAQAQTYPWVGGFLVLCENQGGRGEILSVCLEFYVRKQRKVREFFLWAKPAKSTRWLIIITLLAELGGSDWLVISFIGGEGQYWLLGLDRLQTQDRHLIWNPHRIVLYYIKLRV